MENENPSVWDKFDMEEYKLDLQSTRSQLSTERAGAERRTIVPSWVSKRSFWQALSVLATMIWLYALLKLFVTDFDRWIVSRYIPSWLWLLDYRFFIVLVVAALMSVLMRQWTIVLVLVYIWFFPLVVLLWKLPQLYYRRRSWNLVIGTLQVFWFLGQSLKFSIVATTVFALAALAIVLDGPNGLLWTAVATLLLLWAWLVGRAVVYAIVPSKFMVYQQRVLSGLLDSDRVWTYMAALPAPAKNSAVARLNKSQIDQVVSQASMGLAFFGVCALWAEKLDQYRRSGTSVVFNSFAVVALVAQALAIFTLINLGIYRIDKLQFVYSDGPELSTLIRYSLSSMYAGEIEALRPSGDAANLIHVVATLTCGLIILVLIVSLYSSIKRSQDDHVAEESIRAMRRKADAFENKLTGEYRLSLLDLLSRVSEMGGLFGQWMRQLVYAAIVAHRRAGDEDEHS